MASAASAAPLLQPPLYPPEAELLREIHTAVLAFSPGLRLSALGTRLRYALGRKRMRVMLQPHAGLRNLCCSLGILSPSAAIANATDTGADKGDGAELQGFDSRAADEGEEEEEGEETTREETAEDSRARRHGGDDVIVSTACVDAAVERLLTAPQRDNGEEEEERVTEALGETDAQLVAAMRCSLAAAEEAAALDVSALAAGMSAVLGQDRYRKLLGKHARLRTMCLRLGLVDKQGNVAADRIDALMQRCVDARLALEVLIHGRAGRKGEGKRGDMGAATGGLATVAEGEAVERARKALAPAEKPRRAAPQVPSWRMDVALAEAVAAAKKGAAAVVDGDEAALRELVAGKVSAVAEQGLVDDGPWASRAHLELLLGIERVLMEEAESLALPLDVIEILLKYVTSPTRYFSLLSRVAPPREGSDSGKAAPREALEGWAAQHSLLTFGSKWISADRLGLALERVDINASALLQGTRAELEARVSDSNPTSRDHSTTDRVMLRALADTFAACQWPDMLDTEDLGSLLAIRLTSGRIQLLLDAYGGRLGRFVKAMNIVDETAAHCVLAERVAVFGAMARVNELDEMPFDDLPQRHQTLLRLLRSVVDAGDVPMEAGAAVAALETAEAGAIARALELPKKSKERKLTKALTVFAERYQLLTPQRQLQPASFHRIFKESL